MHGDVEHRRDHLGLPVPRLRFTSGTQVIQGPAVKDLGPVDLNRAGGHS